MLVEGAYRGAHTRATRVRIAVNDLTVYVCSTRTNGVDIHKRTKRLELPSSSRCRCLSL